MSSAYCDRTNIIHMATCGKHLHDASFHKERMIGPL